MKMKKALIAIISTVCAALPRLGYAEDQRAGFYAGPLSVAATTVVEVKTKKPVLDKRQRQAAREMRFVKADKAEKQGSRGLK
ncbi:MAG: hypothetical protein A2Y02_02325 [Omnitrophica bacterium GWA2_52_12]|nr:MAG: hypothetical protein A2Y02_02325 [Omnitrophica bacterium GWA2_52_12]